jgi:hypothetical protein
MANRRRVGWGDCLNFFVQAKSNHQVRGGQSIVVSALLLRRRADFQDHILRRKLKTILYELQQNVLHLAQIRGRSEEKKNVHVVRFAYRVHRLDSQRCILSDDDGYKPSMDTCQTFSGVIAGI